MKSPLQDLYCDTTVFSSLGAPVSSAKVSDSDNGLPPNPEQIQSEELYVG